MGSLYQCTHILFTMVTEHLQEKVLCSALAPVENRGIAMLKSRLTLPRDGTRCHNPIMFGWRTAMKTVTVSTAEGMLSQLLARVEAGEEIILASGTRPIAKLIAFSPEQPGKRQFGALRGIVTVGPEFFEPLPAEELF